MIMFRREIISTCPQTSTQNALVVKAIFFEQPLNLSRILRIYGRMTEFKESLVDPDPLRELASSDS